MIQHNARRQRGQGLIEFAMAALLILGLFAVIDTRIKKTMGGLWLALAKDIAPGCPGCEPPENLR